MEENIELEIRNNINFINKEDKLSMVPYSHSGALTIKIEKKDTNYFLKIMKNSSNFLEKIGMISNIYQELEIKSLNLIEKGILPDGKCYVIYNYLEGNNLNIEEKLEVLNKFYDIGYYIGKNLYKLKQYQPKNKALFPVNDDIDKISTTAFNNFKILYEEKKELINQYISESKIKEIGKKFFKYRKAFKNAEVTLIHGDIKPENIIIQNNICYMTDIEDMQYSYDVINFRYAFFTIFTSEHKQCHRDFYKGVLEGIYDSHIPEDIYQQLNYILILKLYEESYQNYKEDKYSKLIKNFHKYESIITDTNLFDSNLNFLNL